jgi:hypothetical protein
VSWDTYLIWRKQTAEGGQTKWIQTARTLKARNQEEAQDRMRKSFSGAGFTAMALVAVLPGRDPNLS